ncbi:MAG: ABC transporter ATP-binding protein [Acidimicrobiales bacterium]
MTAAIEVEGVSKRFRLYHEKFTSLKERILHGGRVPFEDFWALQDINLRIERGESIGLLGHNGSGKSTLLKCIAGIIRPTEGAISVRGRMAALLELGAGFQPDLSGRENVYLNGSILGMKRAEIDRRFDEIVHFAGEEVERMIDNQVKFYSSGMYVRLGFAVAINVDPDILLVDEVLAVGDEAFQRKCLDKVSQFQREGRTIVVVTHAPDMVRQICTRAAALDHGKLVEVGEPNDVIRTFRERLMTGVYSVDDVDDPNLVKSELSPLWHRVRISEVEVVYPASGRETLRPGEPLQFRIGYEARRGEVSDIVAGIALYSSIGVMIYGTNSHLMGQDLAPVSGSGVITFAVKDLPLLDGTYRLTVGLHNLGGLQYDHWEQQVLFEVEAPGRDIGVVRLDTTIDVEPGAALLGTGPVFRNADRSRQSAGLKGYGAAVPEVDA